MNLKKLKFPADLNSSNGFFYFQTPPQWEGRLFGYDTVSNATFRGRVAYDSVYRRERLIEEYVLGSEDDVFENLYLHNLQIEYQFNLKTKVCKKQPITRPWRDFGIPQNATYLGESYLGSSAVPNGNLLVTIWKDQFIDSQGDTASNYQICLLLFWNFILSGVDFKIDSFSKFSLDGRLDIQSMFASLSGLHFSKVQYQRLFI